MNGSNKQAVDRLDEPVDNPKTAVASTIAVTRKKWVRWKRSGVHQNLLKTMEPATGIEPATCGLRISDSPTSDNLNPPETTKQDAPEVGADGAGLSCPGSSVVADSRSDGEGL